MLNYCKITNSAATVRRAAKPETLDVGRNRIQRCNRRNNQSEMPKITPTNERAALGDVTYLRRDGGLAQ
jgi:hypothetical protein